MINRKTFYSIEGNVRSKGGLFVFNTLNHFVHINRNDPQKGVRRN